MTSTTGTTRDRAQELIQRFTAVVVLFQSGLMLADALQPGDRSRAVPGVLMATIALHVVNRRAFREADGRSASLSTWVLAWRFAAVAALGGISLIVVLDDYGRAPGVAPEILALMVWAVVALKGAAVAKLRPGGPLGLRVPWTLRSPLAWERAHRALGRILFYGALVGLLATPFASFHLSMAGLAALVLSAVGTALYEARRACREDLAVG
ncbi:MAG: hypothetical protein DWQ36_25795 [Acidobacteria bacterium]|nr:MAG: hypothetical protein DWQ30_17620 [Acidobacteriota bacterium]REJ99426.1 MAG: hypothetical protein DWQ36_25795 [Acidobacteriota bacterium]